jgi:hypothetical protein
VADWRFEEGVAGAAASGEGSILDSSGNGLNGTPYGNPVYTAVNAIPGSALALSFNGFRARVAIPDGPQFQLTQSLTLEAYVKLTGFPTGPSTEAQIVFRGDDRGALDPYQLVISSQNTLCFQVTDADNTMSSVCSPHPFPLNQWLHVAGTLDDASGIQNLYINRALVATTTTTIRPFGALDPTQNPGLGIGDVQSANYAEYFNGLIDEVRISNAALTPAQLLPPAFAIDGRVAGNTVSVTCTNTSTQQQINIQLTAGGAWDCIGGGLNMERGQEFTVQLTGVAQ